MFYIKDFYFLFREQGLKGILFLICSILLVFSFASRYYFQHKVKDFTKSEMEKSYILGIAEEKINIQKLKRRLIGLPSVEKIIIKDNISFSQKTHKLISSLGELIPESFINKKYNSIKIYFRDESSSRKRNLVRDYIIRMVGEPNINITNVVDEKKLEKNKNFILKMIQGKSMIIFLVLLICTWSLLLLINRSGLSQKLYLFNQFRRSKSITNKIIFLGLGSLLFTVNFLSCFYYGWNLESFFFTFSLVSVTCLAIRGHKWVDG